MPCCYDQCCRCSGRPCLVTFHFSDGRENGDLLLWVPNTGCPSPHLPIWLPDCFIHQTWLTENLWLFWNIKPFFKIRKCSHWGYQRLVPRARWQRQRRRFWNILSNFSNWMRSTALKATILNHIQHSFIRSLFKKIKAKFVFRPQVFKCIFNKQKHKQNMLRNLLHFIQTYTLRINGFSKNSKE